MKTSLMALTLLLFVGHYGQAQSTIGAKSGGSSASTGSGYTSPGSRPATTDPNSMTIADEGASRSYMYVPPTSFKNRSSSPDGSTDTTSRQDGNKRSTPQRKVKKTNSGNY